MLHPDDARRLLGIPPGYASDLAVTVFHEGEAEAVCPDLAAALPWPVRITTRTDALGRQLTLTGRWGGVAGAALIPALLALALLIVASVRQTVGRRRDIGLLKALGWTTPDIVRLQLYQALFIGLPAAAVGMAAAHALIFWPGADWLGFLLPAWETRPPRLYLHPSGSLSVMLQVAALALIPYLTAVLWPAIRLAATDPEAFLRQGPAG
jgi:ABC-type lipoprotein release transport system permease subunit